MQTHHALLVEILPHALRLLDPDGLLRVVPLHVALAEAGQPLLPRVLQRLAPIELGLLLLLNPAEDPLHRGERKVGSDDELALLRRFDGCERRRDLDEHAADAQAIESTSPPTRRTMTAQSGPTWET